MTTQLKYGRLPATFSLQSVRSGIAMAQALDPLGNPPSESRNYVSKVQVPWQMFLNNVLGCCVAADTGHQVMLRTANAGKIVVPTDAEVRAFYSAISGYVPGKPDTDVGANESDACQYLVNSGFVTHGVAHKADAVGSLDPRNIDHVKWCIELFGGCRLGLNFPKYGLRQFDSGQPFDYLPNDNNTSDGGHDVPLVDYRGGLFYCVTWGRLQPMTPEAVVHWSEEAHVELFYDWIMEQGVSPSGLDLGALAEKLEYL